MTTTDLELPVIGIALYDEGFAHNTGVDEGLMYWEGSLRSPYRLAGTDLPGDVHFHLGPQLDGPWWDPELMNLDVTWDPHRVDVMVYALCASMDIPCPPPGRDDPQLWPDADADTTTEMELS